MNNTQDNAPTIKISKGNAGKPFVVIKDGTIQTKVIEGYDMTKSPSCIQLIDAETLRITNMTLNNRAERGYAFIDYPDVRSDSRVIINNSTIRSTIVALCIQTNEYDIRDNMIYGVVVINGGEVNIHNNVIDVTNVQKGLDQEANRLITSQEIYERCYDVYVTGDKDGYMLTSTDSILIYDRRSTHSTYDNPTVTIENNVLKCKVGDNDTPFGYGIRYMDLNFDPNKTQNGFDLGIIHIGDNDYTYCDNDAPFNVPGGYTIFEA